MNITWNEHREMASSLKLIRALTLTLDKFVNTPSDGGWRAVDPTNGYLYKYFCEPRWFIESLDFVFCFCYLYSNLSRRKFIDFFLYILNLIVVRGHSFKFFKAIRFGNIWCLISFLTIRNLELNIIIVFSDTMLFCFPFVVGFVC